RPRERRDRLPDAGREVQSRVLRVRVLHPDRRRLGLPDRRGARPAGGRLRHRVPEQPGAGHGPAAAGRDRSGAGGDPGAGAGEPRRRRGRGGHARLAGSREASRRQRAGVSAGTRGLLLAALVAAALPARAHVVFERTSLREWLTRSALVVVAEFESDVEMWSAPDGSDRQEFFRVRVLETLKGPAPASPLEFFPHAEGFPRFQAGDRALLFLARSDARREFAALATRFPWFSVQGAGHEWRLAPGAEGARVLATARRWLALRGDAPSDPIGAVRSLLVDQLGSEVPALRADAVAELVRM